MGVVWTLWRGGLGGRAGFGPGGHAGPAAADPLGFLSWIPGEILSPLAPGLRLRMVEGWGLDLVTLCVWRAGGVRAVVQVS